mmetsp:Transcript_64430/g.110635  ORF Transcript_64430/g.110635 Transcript_64430/m.110635 type:complete len:91 (-) Transcript_64430:227-499(-)
MLLLVTRPFCIHALRLFDAGTIKPYFSKKTAELEQLRSQLIARLLKKKEDTEKRHKKKAAAAAKKGAAKQPRKKDEESSGIGRRERQWQY